MTTTYQNVYLKDSSLVVGPYEKEGPYSKYFDLSYEKDLYFGEKSFELAEVKLLQDSMDHLLKKTKKTSKDIDLVISGDLQNQIAASNYAMRNYSIPFLGVYSACATSAESIAIASNMIENHQCQNIICATSSHNMVAEKQFRNPTEYGAPKPKCTTFTATGAVSILLTNQKDKVKIESSTIGKVIDLGVKDVNNMGAVMAPAAADTIKRHLDDTNRTVDYYDLILTGDLGIYGKEILIEYMKTAYNIDLSKNYNDTGTMLYDLEKQKDVHAGGSGPVCSALINFGYIYKQLKEKKLHKVLIVPTGAVFSPTMFFQKQSIPGIAHAISLEAIE